MGKVKKEELYITDHVYQVAGGSLTTGDDAAAFLITADDPILIDTGAGRSIKTVIDNIETAGIDQRLEELFLPTTTSTTSVE